MAIRSYRATDDARLDAKQSLKHRFDAPYAAVRAQFALPHVLRFPDEQTLATPDKCGECGAGHTFGRWEEFHPQVMRSAVTTGGLQKGNDDVPALSRTIATLCVALVTAT